MKVGDLVIHRLGKCVVTKVFLDGWIDIECVNENLLGFKDIVLSERIENVISVSE